MSQKITSEDVESCVLKYQTLFGLKDWRIDVSFTVQDSGSIGDCTTFANYRHAEVSFNLDKIKTRKELEGTVRHEMFHVVLSPFTENITALFEREGEKKVAENLEEMVVDKLEKMPLWRNLDG